MGMATPIQLCDTLCSEDSSLCMSQTIEGESGHTPLAASLDAVVLSEPAGMSVQLQQELQMCHAVWADPKDFVPWTLG